MIDKSFFNSDYCSQCRLNRLKEEAIESEGYKYAAIYVLKQKSTDFKAIDLTNDAPMKENYDKKESPLLQNHCSIVIESLHHEHSEKNSMLPGTPVIHAKQRSSPTANDIELPEELMKKLVKIVSVFFIFAYNPLQLICHDIYQFYVLFYLALKIHYPNKEVSSIFTQ